ncbi:MAG TPA: hypothetical protein VMQ52_00660 [Candidatus Saccharimonadales bacterium]|jgi:hypothetical protein|nr:hypothetical protein [Candidatus Saccharimonadales bacterium]
MEQHIEHYDQILTSEDSEDLDRLMYERAPLDEAEAALIIYTDTGSLDSISAGALQRGIDVIAHPQDELNTHFGFINHLAYLDTMSRIVPRETDDTAEQIKLRIHEAVKKVSDDLSDLITGRQLTAGDLANAKAFISKAHSLSVKGHSFGKTTLHLADN